MKSWRGFTADSWGFARRVSQKGCELLPSFRVTGRAIANFSSGSVKQFSEIKSLKGGSVKFVKSHGFLSAYCTVQGILKKVTFRISDFASLQQEERDMSRQSR